MSEVTLNIRDAKGSVTGRLHAGRVDAVLAALSAEPETIEELEIATARFHKPSLEFGLFYNLKPGFCEKKWDTGIVTFDLTARLVWWDTNYSEYQPTAEIEYHNGQYLTEDWVIFQLPDDWEMVESFEEFESKAPQRRQQRTALPPLDARPVLYGELAGFIVAECLAAEAAGLQEPIRQIHERWLMTPRDDLQGQTPRELLLAKKQFLDFDLQWRELQWSTLGECPPALPLDAYAYRYAGFGTHENVLYYELIRHLLTTCWMRVRQYDGADADFLTKWLTGEQHAWMHDSSGRGLRGMSPFLIIGHERSRLPLLLKPHEHIADEDCPICQAMSEMGGIGFWHLDGCNMDEDFVFSFYRTREEWEEEQRRYEDLSQNYREADFHDDSKYDGEDDTLEPEVFK